ncbi:MAG: ABC transporter, partial [Myxococcota bacterium]
MVGFIINRLLGLVPTHLAVATLVFFIVLLAPGG